MGEARQQLRLAKEPRFELAVAEPQLLQRQLAVQERIERAVDVRGAAPAELLEQHVAAERSQLGGRPGRPALEVGVADHSPLDQVVGLHGVALGRTGERYRFRQAISSSYSSRVAL